MSTRIIADDVIPAEIDHLRSAIVKAKERLAQVRDRAAAHAGPEEEAIFDVQIGILDDHDLINQVESYIRQNLAAEKAFDVVLHEWRARFAHHASPMMRERVGDLTDVHIRLLSLLLGLPDHDPVEVPKGAKAILVTHDLTPSLTVQLDRDAIAGIATDAGTRTSHVAILARSLRLPAVVGLRDAIQRLTGGEHVVLDGSTGTLVINPTDAEVAVFHHRAEREERDEAELRLLVSAEPITTDGVRITLRANVDLPEESVLAATSGAEGVGLMRTEFLVVGRTAMPDEEEQYRAYRRVVEAFGGKPVVIRTFDTAAKAARWRAPRGIRPRLASHPMSRRVRAAQGAAHPRRAAAHGDARIMPPSRHGR